MKRSILSAGICAALSGAALAADIPIYDPAPAPMLSPTPVAYNWTGFYIGLHAGYALKGEHDWDPVDVTNDLDGWFGGATAGAQWQWRRFVLGAEADIGWAQIDGWNVCPNPAFRCLSEVDWLGSVRGRLGFAWDRLLVFGTGGVAFSGFTVEANRGRDRNSVDDTLVGWTAGAGLEWAFTEHLSAKAEYAYYSFDDDTTITGIRTGLDVDFHSFKVGLNWRF